MNFLEQIGFNNDQINKVVSSNHEKVVSKMNKYKDMIEDNIIFLRDLGVSNYREIFTEYSEYFLREPEYFQEILNKYDKDDLVEKLLKNIAIFIRL